MERNQIKVPYIHQVTYKKKKKISIFHFFFFFFTRQSQILLLPSSPNKKRDEAERGAKGRNQIPLPNQDLEGNAHDVLGDPPPLHHQRRPGLAGEGQQDQDRDPRHHRGRDRDGQCCAHREKAEDAAVEDGRVEGRPADDKEGGGGGGGGGYSGVVPGTDGEDEVPGGGEEEGVDEEEEGDPGAALAKGHHQERAQSG